MDLYCWWLRPQSGSSFGNLPVLRGHVYKLLPCLFFASAVTYCASGGGVPANPVTILLDFERPHSQMSLQVMENEVSVLLKATGVALDWQMKNQVRRQY